jgi:hypothetical protein
MLNILHLKVQIIVGKVGKGIMAKLEISRKTELRIKIAHSAHDWREAKSALRREHGLGAGCEAGDRLCQFGGL